MSETDGIIEQYAAHLEAKAAAATFRCTILGGLLGALLGGFPLFHLSNALVPSHLGYATLLLGAAAGAYLGYTFGERRAIEPRFQAQIALRQLQVEQSLMTRAAALVPVSQALVARAPVAPPPVVVAPVAPAPVAPATVPVAPVPTPPAPMPPPIQVAPPVAAPAPAQVSIQAVVPVPAPASRPTEALPPSPLAAVAPPPMLAPAPPLSSASGQ